MAVDWIKCHTESDAAVVVYGNGVESINVVGKLIKLGVPSYRIELVTNHRKIVGFAHNTMDVRVQEMLVSCGVKVHFGCKVVDVQFFDSSPIHSIEIQTIETESRSGDSESLIKCCALLTCVEKVIDTDLYASINDAGLVYDGGIIVDEVRYNHDAVISGMT